MAQTGLWSTEEDNMGVDKDYLDRQLTSADPVDRKSSVRFATTTALPAYARVGNVITASANGALPSQDGVVPIVGNSLLLTDDGTVSNVDNGIYIITQLGSGGAPFILTRRADADASDLVNSGMRVAVEEGTQYQPGTEFVIVTPNPIILNTTALDIQVVESGGAGTLTYIETPKRVGSNSAMLYSEDIRVVDGGDLKVDGDLQPAWSVDNHSIRHIPLGSERVVQQDEVLFYTDLDIDGTLTVDGDLEDITPLPFPTLPIVGELGSLVITFDGVYPFQTVAGQMYLMATAGTEYILPPSPSGAETVAFYTYADTEFSFQLDGGANTVTYSGSVVAPIVQVNVDAGALIFATWSVIFASWIVYGSQGVQPKTIGGLGQTTDATPTTITTFNTNIGSDAVFGMNIQVLGRDAALNLNAHFEISLTLVRDSGVTTVVDELFLKTYKDNVNWDVEFDMSGDNLNVQVVGDAGNTVNWRVREAVKYHG